MRVSIALLIAWSVWVTPSAAQPHDVESAHCRGLRYERARLDLELAGFEPEFARNQELRLLTDTVRGAIAAMDDLKADSDAMSENLKTVIEDVLGNHGPMANRVTQAMEATDAMSAQASAVRNRLASAQAFLEPWLAASEAATPARQLQAFSQYYNSLNEALGPYRNALPFIGQMLEAYGTALNTASTNLSRIEERRATLGRQIEALTGRNPYRILTVEEQRWRNLREARDRISAQIAADQCELPEIPPPPPDVPAEVQETCRLMAGLEEDYWPRYRAILRRMAEARRNISSLQAEVETTRASIRSLEIELWQLQEIRLARQARNLETGAEDVSDPVLQDNERQRITKRRELDGVMQQASQLGGRLSAAHRALETAHGEENAFSAQIEAMTNCMENGGGQCSQASIGADPTACACSRETIAEARLADRAIWGDRYYTSDSHRCLAAVHAGATDYEGGVVRIAEAIPPGTYLSRTRNGIESRSYGSYPSAFRFEGYEPEWRSQGLNLCPPRMQHLRGSRGGLHCFCLPELMSDGAVWGTGLYTDDSRLCRAALHAGAVGPGGGAIRAFSREGAPEYSGSTRNGVESEDYGEWSGSFTVVRGQ